MPLRLPPSVALPEGETLPIAVVRQLLGGVSRTTILNWRRRGFPPAGYDNGWMVPRSGLVGWLISEGVEVQP